MTTLLAPTSSVGCPPRWATARNLGRRTLGPRAAEVAALLGTPLMPWQRQVADTALEVDPDTGRLAYRQVVLTVPRQSGKTTLMLAVMVHRALGFGQRQRIVYTAQNRLKARQKWEDEHVLTLQQSPLRSMFTVRRQIGQEAVRWRNGSIHALDAPTEEAVHGDVLDLGAVDEAFAHEDDRVEQGMKPAMVTRPQPQLWVFSTAGTAKSVYLREKVEAGRLHTEAGIDAGVAYFEWSAPADADPADPAVWWGCMPALGWTVREDAVAADFRSMKLPEFRRAYLNQWPDEAPDEWLVIGEAAWRALADPGSQPAGPVALAADVMPGREYGAVAAAGRRADGNLHVEITGRDNRYDHRPGTAWMVDRLVELAAAHRPCAVVIDGAGEAGSLIAPLEAAGVEVVKPTLREATQAAGQFVEAVTDAGSLRHLGQPPLDAALAGARKREVSDAWLWARKGLSVDICPLVAVTLAAWGHATRGHLGGDYDVMASIY
jgi:phage terminase large subunit-like protein